MSNGNGGNNCEETIFHDGNVTFVRTEGDRRDFIQTIDETEYARRLVVTKERIAIGRQAGWTPARLALSTEIMFGYSPEEVDAFDPATHESVTGLSRSEQYAHAFTIMESLVDVGVIPNHDSVVARESMDHIPGQVNPLLPPEYAAYHGSVVAAAA